MAESKDSKSLDSARLVLPHALLFESGKASLGFFGVVDSVSCLDSEKLDSRFCFCESWLDSKLFLDCESIDLDSKSAWDCARGLPRLVWIV